MKKLNIGKIAGLMAAVAIMVAPQAKGIIVLGTVAGNKSTPAVATWLDGLVNTYNGINNPDLPYPPGAELFRVNQGLTTPVIVGSPPSGYWKFGAGTLTADLSLLAGKYNYVALHWGGSGGGSTSAYYIGDVTSGPLTFNAPGQNGLSWYDGFSATPVPEPTTLIAGALLLLPFGASTIRFLRKNRTA